MGRSTISGYHPFHWQTDLFAYKPVCLSAQVTAVLGMGNFKHHKDNLSIKPNQSTDTKRTTVSTNTSKLTVVNANKIMCILSYKCR